MSRASRKEATRAFLGPIGRLADAGIDWQGIGFRSGLEIHQQLLTDRKLFCRCPAGLYSPSYDMEILRHMRPTLSEMGEYDGTALMEFKTKKEVIYRMKRESVCTYEMDDTPPFEINARAVDIALEIALLCGCSLVGELHVIRKQYLDGSIPAGFQRTAIVGVDGAVPFNGRTLHITQVSVEEDACREVTDEGHRITFLTDRLSMPLVEIVTEPEFRSPSEVGQGAALLGNLMRVTGKVRRGLGAVRQDVNVSVAGGTRVEIKGVPRIKMIPPLVRNEALRQRALLGIRDRLDVAHRTEVSFVKAVDDIVSDSRSELFGRATERGDAVMAVRVPGGRAVLEAPTQPERRFVDELAGRIRVISCLPGPPYCVTSALQAGISRRRWKRIRNRARARKADAVVVCWGAEADVRTALDEVVIRFTEAEQGVPGETRQAMGRGLTDFERILPGPDRMYPDTDSPPTAITDHRIDGLRAELPSTPWEREALLAEAGVPYHQRSSLAIGPRYALAARLIEAGSAGGQVAHLLAQLLPGLGRRGWAVEALDDELLAAVAEQLRSEQLQREGVKALLRGLLEALQQGGDAPDAGECIRRMGLTPFDGDLVKEVAALLEAAPAPSSDEADARERYGMGLVMAALRGRVSGREVQKTVRARVAAIWPARKGAAHVG